MKGAERKMKQYRTIAILLALLLAAMAIVPIVNAAEMTADIQEQEKLAKEWQENHRLKVTQTTISTYNDDIYEIVTTYTGNGMKGKTRS